MQLRSPNGKNKPRKEAKSQEPLIEQLYQNIGRLQVELEWLKKNLELPLESKRRLSALRVSVSYWGLTAAVTTTKLPKRVSTTNT